MMTDENSNAITIDTLASDYMAVTGCARADADELLAQVAAYWRCTADELAILVSRLTATSGAPSFYVFAFLAVAPLLGTSPLGRELVFFAALEVAKRYGIAPELVQHLLAECRPAPGTEPVH